MAVVLGAMFSPNVGWLFMSVTTGMYLIYDEFMHFCCHVDENWFVRNCPFVNTLRRHHTAHQNAKLMMETNMNSAFPIADWLFGTSDLDRGLIGADTRHLKKNLRGQPHRPDEAQVIDQTRDQPNEFAVPANRVACLSSSCSLCVENISYTWFQLPLRRNT
jgi:hypothetical protein